MNKFWNVKKTDVKRASLSFLGSIADEKSWGGKETTPSGLQKDLKDLGDIDFLDVHINSGGGSVFAGQAIYAMIKSHKAYTTVYVDGLAASIASVIAMAGDEIIMYPGSMIMVHNPWTNVKGGDAETFRQTADVLDKIRDSIVAVYVDRTGLPADRLITMMNAETWMTAAEAVAAGFATKISSNLQIAASMQDDKMILNGVTFDMSNYLRGKEIMDRMSNPTKGEKPMNLETLIAQLPNHEQSLIKMVAQSALAALENVEPVATIPSASTEPVAEPVAEPTPTEPTVEPTEPTEPTEPAEPTTEPEPTPAEPEAEPESPADEPTEGSVTDNESTVQINALQAQLAAATAKLQAIENEQDLAKYVDLVNTFDRLPISAKEFGPIFQTFAKADKAGFDKLAAVLKAANNAVEAGALFTTTGTSAGAEGQTAWDVIQFKANALVTEKKAKNFADAVSVVMKAESELYNRYVQEMQADPSEND